jgi:hypothetical protein
MHRRFNRRSQRFYHPSTLKLKLAHNSLYKPQTALLKKQVASAARNPLHSQSSVTNYKLLLRDHAMPMGIV